MIQPAGENGHRQVHQPKVHTRNDGPRQRGKNDGLPVVAQVPGHAEQHEYRGQKEQCRGEYAGNIAAEEIAHYKMQYDQVKRECRQHPVPQEVVLERQCGGAVITSSRSHSSATAQENDADETNAQYGVSLRLRALE